MFKKVLYALATLFAIALPEAALAQTVTQLPAYINGGSAGYDFGNGPIELKIIQGSGVFTTSQGYGVVSSISGTLITLTATPTTIPCFNTVLANTTGNCIISGGTMTSGTLAGSFNPSTGTGTGTGPSVGIASSTGITTGQLTAGMIVGWGGACPATFSGPGVPLQAAVSGDFPFYTQARVCGYSPANTGPGAAVLPFAIGGH